MALGLTTELSAVNLMLRAIGESPASSLASLPDDGISARQVLTDVARQVLTEGWHFNTDVEFPLTASVTPPYEIAVPATAISVDLSKYTTASTGTDLVIRQGKLYDRCKHTFSFEGQQFLCDIVWLFDFEELPEALRQYVNVRAARQFYHDTLQAETQASNLSAEKEQMLRTLWEAEDQRTADTNLIWSNPQLAILRRNTR